MADNADNESLSQESGYEVFHNLPHAIEHFVGRREILQQIVDELLDKETRLSVVLGMKGTGKSALATMIGHYFTEYDTFQDGIFYLPLYKMYQHYGFQTFDDCFLHMIQKCKIEEHWALKEDEKLTKANMYQLMYDSSDNVLIIIDDFDRFAYANRLTNIETSKILNKLFRALRNDCKVVLTSRTELPVYNNFYCFVTKYYAIEPLDLRDASELLSQLTQYSVGEIRSQWNEFRDVTMFKPLHIKKLARLNAKLRYEELSFGELLSLYQDFDVNFLASHSNFPPVRAVSKKHSTDDVESRRPGTTRGEEEEEDLLADEDDWDMGQTDVEREREEEEEEEEEKAEKAGKKRRKSIEKLETNNDEDDELAPSHSDNDEVISMQNRYVSPVTMMKIHPQSATNLHVNERRLQTRDNSGNISLGKKNDINENDSKQKRSSVPNLIVTNPYPEPPTMLSASKLSNTSNQNNNNVVSSPSNHMGSVSARTSLSGVFDKAPLQDANASSNHRSNSTLSPSPKPSSKSLTKIIMDDSTKRKKNSEDNKEKDKQKEKERNGKKNTTTTNKDTIIEENQGTKQEMPVPTTKLTSRNKGYSFYTQSSPSMSTGSTASMYYYVNTPQNTSQNVTKMGSGLVSVTTNNQTSDRNVPISTAGGSDRSKKTPQYVVNNSGGGSGKVIHVSSLKVLDPDGNAEETDYEEEMLPAIGPGHGDTVADRTLKEYVMLMILLPVATHRWSRQGFLEGVARAMRCDAARYKFSKVTPIGDNYSYIRLICRCEENEVIRLKSIFELVFLSEQLQTCLEDSLGHRKLRIHIACALSFDSKTLGKIYDKKLIYVLRQLPDGFVKNGNVKRSSLLFGVDPMALLAKATTNKSSRRLLIMDQASTNVASAGMAQVTTRSHANSPSMTHSRRHSLNISPLGTPVHAQTPSHGGNGHGAAPSPAPMMEDLVGSGNNTIRGGISRQRSERNNSIDMGEVHRWQEWQREQDETQALAYATTNKDKESVLSAPYIELPLPKILPLTMTTEEYQQRVREKEKEKQKQKPPNIDIAFSDGLLQPQSPILTPENRTILHFLSIPYNPLD